MKPKSMFLVTAFVGALGTGCAFGAASLRTTQTVPSTPGINSAARAGTLRMNTLKVNAPTTTAIDALSTGTSLGSENTPARIAFMPKQIKDIGKIKNVKEADQKLDSLNSRIDELQEKLDSAEAVADKSVKIEEIESKIDEKLTAIGTTGKTYSKEDVNSMIPTLDGRGNASWTDPNGTLNVQPLYWVFHSDNNPITSVTLYGTYTHPTTEMIQNWVRNICASSTNSQSHSMIDCCYMPSTHPNFTAFGVERLYEGYNIRSSNVVYHNNRLVMEHFVETYATNPTSYIRQEFCGTRPESECWVENHGSGTACSKTWTGLLVYSTFETSGSEPTVNNDRGTVSWNAANGELVSIPAYHFRNWYCNDDAYEEGGLGRTCAYITNAPVEKIQIFANKFCEDYDEGWCKWEYRADEEHLLNDPHWIATLGLTENDRIFTVVAAKHGHLLDATEMTTVNNQLKLWRRYKTRENSAVTYIRNQICQSNNECNVYDCTGHGVGNWHPLLGICVETPIAVPTPELPAQYMAPNDPVIITCPEGCVAQFATGNGGQYGAISCWNPTTNEPCGEASIKVIEEPAVS